MRTRSSGKEAQMKPVLRTVAAFAAIAIVAAAQQINALTTTMDAADILKRIGGDTVAVESLARGDQDFHRIPAQPKVLLKLNRADALFELGLDLEHAWLPALLESCRN